MTSTSGWRPSAGRSPTPSWTIPAGPGWRSSSTSAAELLAAAQEDDGYLDSHFQVRFPGERFVQLAWGHELYCAGHLIQAAVALHRTTADARLLDIAGRFADLVVRSFGAAEGQIDGVCGHPEIESALVELFRETGEESYLRPPGTSSTGGGTGCWVTTGSVGTTGRTTLPVREAQSVEGHAVRQLYLLAGVADVYAETGDEELREAAERLWHEMVATKTYLTGGVGAHHSDEAFGDPYELPNERSYCETCAAIASVMFSWRMLMITGEARYADLIERTLYNGFLGGLSLDGQRYIYANPLQVREGHLDRGGDGDYARKPWFSCACCPPNVMRMLASLEHYVVLGGDTEVRLHQYIAGTFELAVAGERGGPPGGDGLPVGRPGAGRGRSGRRVVAAGAADPEWAESFTLSVNGEAGPAEASDGWLSVDRAWTVGDEIVLDLALDVRFTQADPRVDAAPRLPGHRARSAGLLPRGRRPPRPAARRPRADAGP